MRDFDDLLKYIDALVDWQLTNSPAAQVQSQPEVYDLDEDELGGEWDAETMAEYERLHTTGTTELKTKSGKTIRIHFIKCHCGDVCKFIDHGDDA